MEFFLHLGFNKGKPQAKDRALSTPPIRGDLIVQACEPNERSGILRFSHCARFCVPKNDGPKDFIELFDPAIIYCVGMHMEIHGYEKGDDAIYMQSWILKPTIVDPARDYTSHLHGGPPKT